MTSKRKRILKKTLKKTLKKDLKKFQKKSNKKNKSLKKELKNAFSGLQFLNVGSTNTIIRNNDDIKNSSIKWSGNYDGKIANIHVDVNDNGRKENMDINLTNDDLTQLLGYPAVEKQIDTRLFDDFLGNQEPIYIRTK